MSTYRWFRDFPQLQSEERFVTSGWLEQEGAEEVEFSLLAISGVRTRYELAIAVD
jgi:hypothetical protein